MSTTRREVPVTSIYAKAVFTGNVSGDVTTITSVTFTQNEDDWLLGVKKEDMPSVMIIDGKQYRWDRREEGKRYHMLYAAEHLWMIFR